MKKCRKTAVSLLLLVIATFVYAQPMPLNTWKTHFSYSRARLLTSVNQKIFCVAENGIFSVDRNDNSISIISKINGLSDVAPSAITYSSSHELLILGYPSGLLDLISSSEIVTIVDINGTSLPGEKVINDITVHEDKVYLSTSFGIIVVDLIRKEIRETFSNIGKEGSRITVFETAIIMDTLYAVTETGIQRGSLSQNLLDFNNWIPFETDSSNYKSFEVLQGRIYTLQDQSTLVCLEGSQLNEIDSIPQNNTLISLSTFNEDLYVLAESGILRLDGDSLVQETVLPPASAPRDFIVTSDGFWIADETLGLTTPDGSHIIPAGPLSDQISKIRYVNNNLYAFYAPKPSTYFGQVTHNLYSYYDQYFWHDTSIDDFYNISDAALYNGKIFFSSIGYGLYNSSENNILDENTSLFSGGKQGNGVIIPELASGKELYIPTFKNENSLFTLTTDMQLTAYSENLVGTDEPLSINRSGDNTLWITRGINAGGGIITLDPDDNLFRQITTSDGLPSNTVNDVAISLNDESWVASSKGPAYFGNASFIFENTEAVRPIYEGYNLFDDEAVSAISTDGGNRVWIATKEGVWVFDQDISVQLSHFSTENSPLPSNTVKEFAYNPETGEMYILTDHGLVSYRSNSSNPSSNHREVQIFPNPVKPGFTGLVGITGLPATATVKITTAEGKLIKELIVNGGTASWDQTDYNNRKVQSGVYIVLSSTSDGLDSFVAKLAVIR